ncbi:MAG: Hsp70 family protein [Polyangiaceae bacterium]
MLFFGEGGHFSCGAAAIHDFVEGGMGGRFIRSIKKYLPDRGFAGTQIGFRTLTIENLIAVFLRTMRERANEHFGVSVERVVLGRPAKFSAREEEDACAQDRLERAARLAGFTEVSFCPEPVAAAHDFHLDLERPSHVLVADFGGGTSDFTVVRMHRGGFSPDDVLALGGVSLAGDVLDGCIMRRKVARHFGADVTYKVPMGHNVLPMPRPIIEKLCSPADMTVLRHRDILAFLEDVKAWSLGKDDRRRMDQLLTLVEDSLAFQIFDAIERSKCELSDRTETTIAYDYPSIHIRETMTRGDFEAAAERPIDTIIEAMDRTVESAGLSHAEVDVVCCTGGTAKVPKIARAIEERFGSGKVRTLRAFHSVVQGLSERARQIAASA